MCASYSKDTQTGMFFIHMQCSRSNALLSQVSPAKRYIWLLTYGASALDITHQMLRGDCKIDADEVYTTKERVHKYTLIHLKKPLCITSIQKGMKILFSNYHIIQGDITGYDAIDSSEKKKKKRKGADKNAPKEYHSIEDHVAYLQLVKDMNDTNSDFKIWKENELHPGILEAGRQLDPLKPFNTQYASKDKLISTIAHLQSALKAAEEKATEARRLLRDMDSIYSLEKKHRMELEEENKILKKR